MPNIPEQESIFNKIFTYSFSEDQVKKILVDLLLLSGEIIPVDVHDSLDPDAFCQFDSPIKVVSESSSEIAETFLLRLSFTDEDLKDFQENYDQEFKAMQATGKETPAGLPENVWTQDTALPCGKE